MFVTFRNFYKYLKYTNGKYQDTIKIQKGVHEMYKLEMKKTFTDEDRSKINDVISQFFEEFNPESSIDLKNGICHISVVFENPPKELIKKIMESNPDEFRYGASNITDIAGKKQTSSANSDESEETATDSKDSNNESEEETESEDSDESEGETETEPEDSDESVEETETESEDSDESEEETNQKAENAEAPIATMPKTKKVGGKIKKCGEIKLLLDLADKSRSYEEFVKLIVKTINFGKREEFFIKLVNGFTANKEAGLAKISKDLGISKNDYNSMGMQVSNYFKRNGEKVSFGGFINEIVQYKDYSFETGNEDSKIETSDEPTDVPVSTEQDASDSKEDKISDSTEHESSDSEEDESNDSAEDESRNSAEQAVAENKVPVIPEFEEFLGNIDKTISIEKRVETVLSYIDPKIEKRIWDQRAIRNYVIAGISLKVITNEAIMKKDRWLPPDARMKTSMLVTDFIKAKSNGSELVKVVDFLEYLKKFILTEEELRKL